MFGNTTRVTHICLPRCALGGPVPLPQDSAHDAPRSTDHTAACSMTAETSAFSRATTAPGAVRAARGRFALASHCWQIWTSSSLCSMARNHSALTHTPSPRAWRFMDSGCGTSGRTTLGSSDICCDACAAALYRSTYTNCMPHRVYRGIYANSIFPFPPRTRHFALPTTTLRGDTKPLYCPFVYSAVRLAAPRRHTS